MDTVEHTASYKIQVPYSLLLTLANWTLANWTIAASSSETSLPSELRDSSGAIPQDRNSKQQQGVLRQQKHQLEDTERQLQVWPETVNRPQNFTQHWMLVSCCRSSCCLHAVLSAIEAVHLEASVFESKLSKSSVC